MLTEFFRASGPFHVLFPLPGTLFLEFSAWLVRTPQLSSLSGKPPSISQS